MAVFPPGNMLFNSLQFLIFFLIVTLWFFRIKNQRGRLWLLLIASCYFYMSFIPKYIIILGGTILIDYLAGIQIEKSRGPVRKYWLVVSLITNIGILAFFKYYNFFIDNVNTGLIFFHKQAVLSFLNIALPIGLSFHTFQAMSYTIEVYRGNQPAEKNFLTYALYVMFYPQLVAGPIERPQNVLPQLHQYKPYDWNNVKEGLAQMAWGFFKKVVIADRLAMAVDYTYAHHQQLSAPVLIAGAILYSFQIYCDFSGYSDIALGAAKVMGIRLMTNFNRPLSSRSVTEFWRRWHISLSTWFNDYLFIPIVTALRDWGKMAVIAGLLITFFISGFWHGAGWNYIIYGLLHGIMIMYEFLTKKFRKRLFSKAPLWLNNSISLATTYVYIVFSWIFFRSSNAGEAFRFIKDIFIGSGSGKNIGINNAEIIFSVCAIVAMLWREKRFPKHFIASNRLFSLYIFTMVVICYFFGVFGENQFIYFQF